MHLRETGCWADRKRNCIRIISSDILVLVELNLRFLLLGCLLLDQVYLCSLRTVSTRTRELAILRGFT
jgi:hypothetical protein